MSSRFFPHTPYAEDQPYARSILTYHVLARGFQTGAVIGSGIGLARILLRRPKPWMTMLSATGYGALIGTAIFIPGLPLYMSGKTDIEWKDRTWRLLENPGQKEVDDWISVGFVVGGLVAAGRKDVRRRAVGLGLRPAVVVVGAAAAGDLVGVLGYMVWRHGIHGGKWPEEGEKGVGS